MAVFIRNSARFTIARPGDTCAQSGVNGLLANAAGLQPRSRHKD